MELTYRLAVSDAEFIKTIRDSAIVMITPIMEVDGRAKVVDLHMARHRDPDFRGPSRPLYWGKYVAHDNNRDGIGLSLKLSQHVTRTFLEYRPQILHDLHESASQELAVYFNSSPVFATGGGGGRFGRFGRQAPRTSATPDPGSTLARRTGRGGREEKDVVQGRARDLGRAGVEAFEERQDEEEADQQGTSTTPPPNDNRIIFRFAPAKDLPISGGLKNGAEMAGAPALVDAPHGDGHIVLFGFNPFWRGETVGPYALVFNTLLHHGHLDAGQKDERPTTDQDGDER